MVWLQLLPQSFLYISATAVEFEGVHSSTMIVSRSHWAMKCEENAVDVMVSEDTWRANGELTKRLRLV
jgi:hypothetical protein